MPSPETFKTYLGAGFVTAYTKPALTIGDRSFTRYEVAHSFDCPVTPRAMRILSDALAALGCRTARAALEVRPEDLADLPGVGVTTIYLFLCWQRAERHSDRALAAWYGEQITFPTLKARVAKRKAREAPRKRRTA